MIVYKSLEEIQNIMPTCIALGNFDGVHIGHIELFKNTVALAKEKKCKSAVFTFSNHPKNILPNGDVKNVLYNEQKIKIIERYNIDYLFNIAFDENIMAMSPEDFIDKILIMKCNMKEAFCGFNYNFGHKARGNVDLLRKYSEEKQYGVNILPPFEMEEKLVSSTLIRDYIINGDIESCNKLLGRNYEVEGEVVMGNKLGKSLGFPTSNLTVDETMVTPANGVYVTYCTYNGIRYKSITNVGIKPTIGENKKNMETHIFDFDKELYGKRIKVEFVKKLRDEKKFNSLKELSNQIVQDCNVARSFHKLNY